MPERHAKQKKPFFRGGTILIFSDATPMPVWSLRNTGIALYRVVSRKNNIVTCQTASICLCDAHIFMRNQIIIRERRITNRAVAWGEWGALAKQLCLW